MHSTSSCASDNNFASSPTQPNLSYAESAPHKAAHRTYSQEGTPNHSLVLNASGKPSVIASRFKTSLCATFEQKGKCKYSYHCMFAHGEADKRTVDDNIKDGIIDEASIDMYRKNLRLRQRQDQSQGYVTIPNNTSQNVSSNSTGSKREASPLGTSMLPPPLPPPSRHEGSRSHSISSAKDSEMGRSHSSIGSDVTPIRASADPMIDFSAPRCDTTYDRKHYGNSLSNNSLTELQVVVGYRQPPFEDYHRPAPIVNANAAGGHCQVLFPPPYMGHASGSPALSNTPSHSRCMSEQYVRPSNTNYRKGLASQSPGPRTAHTGDSHCGISIGDGQSQSMAASSLGRAQSGSPAGGLYFAPHISGIQIGGGSPVIAPGTLPHHEPLEELLSRPTSRVPTPSGHYRHDPYGGTHR